MTILYMHYDLMTKVMITLIELSVEIIELVSVWSLHVSICMSGVVWAQQARYYIVGLKHVTCKRHCIQVDVEY